MGDLFKLFMELVAPYGSLGSGLPFI